MKESIPRAIRQLDKSKPPFGFEPFNDSVYRRSRRRLESRRGKAGRASEFTQMRIVAVIVEVAASGLTKIPISDQVCFLSNRLTAQSGPRKPIVSKNRAGRERINLWRQDRSTSTAIDPRHGGYFIGGVNADRTRKLTLIRASRRFFGDRSGNQSANR